MEEIIITISLIRIGIRIIKTITHWAIKTKKEINGCDHKILPDVFLLNRVLTLYSPKINISVFI